MNDYNYKIKQNISYNNHLIKSFKTSYLIIRQLKLNKNYKNLSLFIIKFILIFSLLIISFLLLLIMPSLFIYYLVDTIKLGNLFSDGLMMLGPLFLLLGSIEYLFFKIFYLIVLLNSKNNLYEFSNINN